MQYCSTRDIRRKNSSAACILEGIAPDGGLYVPETFPLIPPTRVQSFADMPYHRIAETVLSAFLTDYDPQDLSRATQEAYAGQWDDPEITPMHKLHERESVLELWHGPTLAFKDVALQLLPRLMTLAKTMQGIDEDTLILVATSGDTGKAALQGFMDVPGTKITVFYPKDGVSVMQRLQMVTQEGGNVSVVAVNGNFDDTQSGVKAIFADSNIARVMKEKNIHLSSANSINWGRLVPQIVYYFAAYARLTRQGLPMGDRVNFVIPTGNFGNILAGFYARQIGLPIHKLICASNANNVLYDFFARGLYNRNRPFYTTQSPSMDILISSNLERLVFEATSRDDQATREYMEKLSKTGEYTLNMSMLDRLDMFYAGWTDDQGAQGTIKRTFERYGYLMDPHTAIGQTVYEDYLTKTGDTTHTVLLSTASPYKFAPAVAQALGLPAQEDEMKLCEILRQQSGLPLPQSIARLPEMPVLHTALADPAGMGFMLLNRW